MNIYENSGFEMRICLTVSQTNTDPEQRKHFFLESGLPTPNSWPGLRGISGISNLAMAGHDGPGTPGGAALEPCSGWTSSAAGRRPSPVPPNVSAEMKGELWIFFARNFAQKIVPKSTQKYHDFYGLVQGKSPVENYRMQLLCFQ